MNHKHNLHRAVYSGLVLLLLTSCGLNPITTSTPQPPISTITNTAEPSNTPEPTFSPTVIPPTAYPLPTENPELKRPADLTVCSSGCSYTTLQAAINSLNGEKLTIIEMKNQVHTEAGIVVNQDVVISGAMMIMGRLSKLTSPLRKHPTVFF